MKKNEKKKRIIAFILAVALIITGAFAYFTAQDSKNNQFVVGNVRMELWEDFDTNGDGTLSSNETYGPDSGKDISYLPSVLPTDEVIKAPYIKNVGKNDAYVYMAVGVPVVSCKFASENDFSEKEFFKLNNLSSDWNLMGSRLNYVDSDGSVWNYYLYTYKDILPGSETQPDAAQRVTSKLFETVEIINYSDVAGKTLTTKDGTITFDDSYTAISGIEFYNAPEIDTIDKLENCIINYEKAAETRTFSFEDILSNPAVVPFSEGMEYLGATDVDTSYDDYVYLYQYDGLTCAFSMYPSDLSIDTGWGPVEIKSGLSVSTNVTGIDVYKTTTSKLSSVKIPINAYAVQSRGKGITDVKTALTCLIDEKADGFLSGFNFDKVGTVNYYIPADVANQMNIDYDKTFSLNLETENSEVPNGEYCKVNAATFIEGQPVEHYSDTQFDIVESKVPSDWMAYNPATNTVSTFDKNTTLENGNTEIDAFLSYSDRSEEYPNLVPQKYYVYYIEPFFYSTTHPDEWDAYPLKDYGCAANFVGISEDYFIDNNIPYDAVTGKYPAVSVKLPSFVPYQWKEYNDFIMDFSLVESDHGVCYGGSELHDRASVSYTKNDYGYYIKAMSNKKPEYTNGYPDAMPYGIDMIPVSGGTNYACSYTFGAVARDYTYDYFYFEPELFIGPSYREVSSSPGYRNCGNYEIWINTSCNVAEIAPTVDTIVIGDMCIINKLVTSDRVRYVEIMHFGEVNELYLGASVMGVSTFDYMDYKSYSTVTVSENNENFCAVNNMLYSKDKTVLWTYPYENSIKPNILASTKEILCGSTVRLCPEIRFDGTIEQLEDILFCCDSCTYNYTQEYDTDDCNKDDAAPIRYDMIRAGFMLVEKDLPFAYLSDLYSHTEGFGSYRILYEGHVNGAIYGKIGRCWARKIIEPTDNISYAACTNTPVNTPFICSDGTVTYSLTSGIAGSNAFIHDDVKLTRTIS